MMFQLFGFYCRGPVSYSIESGCRYLGFRLYLGPPETTTRAVQLVVLLGFGTFIITISWLPFFLGSGALVLRSRVGWLPLDSKTV